MKQRQVAATTPVVAPDILPASPTLSELLSTAEAKIATPELMNTFVATFFDTLKRRLSASDFSEFFSLEFTEHPDFREPTTKRFIIEILSRQKRTDNFVTAELSRQSRRSNPLLGIGMASWLTQMYDDDQ